MRDQISRLMDGDLDGAEADAVFRELKTGDGLESWACYHVIGDCLRRSGTPIPINDVWIASQAMEAGAQVITYDRHFNKVKGLILWDKI